MCHGAGNQNSGGGFAQELSASHLHNNWGALSARLVGVLFDFVTGGEKGEENFFMTFCG